MEPSIKQVMDSPAFPIQKSIINREVNWGGKEYFLERNSKGETIFKKTDEEKALLANLRAKWLKNMRAMYQGFTKRKGGSKKFRQTLSDGEDI